MKFKILVLCSLLTICCSFTFAQNSSHRSAAEELILLSNPDKMLDQIWGEISNMLNQQFKQMGAPEKYQPILDKHTKRMFQVLQNYLSFENLKDDYITMYVNTYSEEEIRAIVDFYKSPAGKVFLEKMPKLVQKSMAITQNKMPAVMPEIQRISRELEMEIIQMEQQ